MHTDIESNPTIRPNCALELPIARRRCGSPYSLRSRGAPLARNAGPWHAGQETAGTMFENARTDLADDTPRRATPCARESRLRGGEGTVSRILAFEEETLRMRSVVDPSPPPG